ncbi:TIGR03557 family F420-dependent LLM class oxidoreductase [Streptomyces hydrogenans]|uniref:LLM class F420-dependent oxidoreductase n=2 Tax=Streptomyces hydrogenans TaxID=1873719 RepID=A0ABQ3PPU9_9ACTN|nr:TIGR03557 family F420-dependent LLM class oxidoreductase [Streptomyces hydrogenans]GHG13826.1 LLM class F420-dependent oxidoreductase [Streptomyces hydrogenans]GHI24275.1 LLM class F420-dependent oxidoreductase [Streptomyces hydrogenans]GHI24286.1 LLM class F420-dependent oxidoreductase [Streptomyces hydrogenans]GHI25963.1 LLM class F420-dependent oxidoreductase [Streptomyces hydrogenans]GHI27022.1 LLM class F420-dependent oxidoreductase [Streptomyces hydrogenans]
MTHFGYTMMTEQAGPRELVDHVVEAERVGFDFSVVSDHYFPWLDAQGHSPYAWSVLGAAAQATTRIPLMTFVTCPTFRYHPAVVAQKAATVQLLSEGRFRLGLGSGENLNEHVTGAGWPTARTRLERLEEAVDIIRALFAGEDVTYHGRHFDVTAARLWDLPDRPPPLGIAASGPRSCALAGRRADLLVAVEPRRDLTEDFDRHGGTGKPRIGQLALCYDTDRDAAVARAHEQFRWSLGGWRVNPELPLPAGFAQATRHVTPEDVAGAIPCGDDPGAVVEAADAYRRAGFTDLALVQIGGGHQAPFLEWARTTLLPALRAAWGTGADATTH